MEVEVLSPGVNVTTSTDAPFAMLRLVNTGGGASGDITFAPVPVAPGSGYSIVNGSTNVAETNMSGLEGVCVLTTDLPASGALAVPSASPFARSASTAF